jgi:hypothetical protein
MKKVIFILVLVTLFLAYSYKSIRDSFVFESSSVENYERIEVSSNKLDMEQFIETYNYWEILKFDITGDCIGGYVELRDFTGLVYAEIDSTERNVNRTGKIMAISRYLTGLRDWHSCLTGMSMSSILINTMPTDFHESKEILDAVNRLHANQLIDRVSHACATAMLSSEGDNSFSNSIPTHNFFEDLLIYAHFRGIGSLRSHNTTGIVAIREMLIFLLGDRGSNINFFYGRGYEIMSDLHGYRQAYLAKVNRV